MRRTKLLAIPLLAPLLTAGAPPPGPILLTSQLAPPPRSQALCHIWLGMASAEPVAQAVILKLSASFAGGIETQNVRVLPADPGQWAWREVLFHGNCAADYPPPVIHVQEAVCATWAKYVDCVPELRFRQGNASLQLQ
jgi:hypothetical protein